MRFWNRFRMRHGWAAGCGRGRGDRIERVLGHVERSLELTPTQTDAWKRFAAVLRSSGASLEKVWHDLGSPSPAPDCLARVETLVRTGLDLLREVRPAIDELYTVLNERQRRTLDDLLTRRRHRWPRRGKESEA